MFCSSLAIRFVGCVVRTLYRDALNLSLVGFAIVGVISISMVQFRVQLRVTASKEVEASIFSKPLHGLPSSCAVGEGNHLIADYSR